MFQHAAAPPHRRQRSREASTIIAATLADASALDHEWRAEPQLAPTLARRVGYDRQRAVVGASVARFRPRVHIGQTVV